MKKTFEAPESSELYRKIDELGLTPTEHARAIAALESAKKIGDAFYWVFEKLEQLASGPAPGTVNSKLKHQ